jgi:CheY-specific phosphatase CheX
MMYLCMDGYTKMKLLPRIAERYQIDAGQRGMADSVLLEFSNQIASNILSELRDGGYHLELQPPESLNHKIVPIDLKRNRQYILIFFLRDRRMKRYLGRATLVLTLEKY